MTKCVNETEIGNNRTTNTTMTTTQFNLTAQNYQNQSLVRQSSSTNANNNNSAPANNNAEILKDLNSIGKIKINQTAERELITAAFLNYRTYSYCLRNLILRFRANVTCNCKNSGIIAKSENFTHNNRDKSPEKIRTPSSKMTFVSEWQHSGAQMPEHLIVN
jgi:hypothetical protein